VNAKWALILLLARGACAQDFNVTATVNTTLASLEDRILLTVTVSGARNSVPDPRLPPIPAFDVHGAGKSNNFSFINGAVSSSAEYRFILVPRFPGKSVIGPIVVEDGGVSRQTAPIEITVLKRAPPQGAPPGASAPAPPAHPQARAARGGPDLFVTAEVDKRSPFVNEQVLLTVRFYTAVPVMGNAQWKPPSAQGFMMEDIPPSQARQVVENGRRYSLSEIRVALFPAQAGELVIGPSSILCEVQQAMDVDPFSQDFFQRFFSQGGLSSVQRKELKTPPIALSVRPLPQAGKPPSFSGAVGSLRAGASVDKRKLRSGEALGLTVTVEGSANLKGIGGPPLPEMAQFRTYDTVSSLNLVKDEGGVRGSKTFKTVLVPKVSGKLVIPAIPFSFFDPQRKAYQTVETRAIELDVSPGDAQAPAPAFVSPGAQGGGSIRPMMEDIRYIKPRREPGLPRPVRFFAGNLAPHALPLSALLLSLAAFLYREKLASDPSGTRLRNARPKAERAIARARRALPGDPERCVELLSGALAAFLADKLDCPPSSLTGRLARLRIQERFPAVPEASLERLRSLFDEIELRRFAPADPKGDGDAGRLAEGVLGLVRALDEEMRR
jgi:hypothetical protein